MAQLTILGDDRATILHLDTIGPWVLANTHRDLVLYDGHPDHGGRMLTADDAGLLDDPSALLFAQRAARDPWSIAFAVVAVLSAAYSIYMANNIKMPDAAGNSRPQSAQNSLGKRVNAPLQPGQRRMDIRGYVPRAYPALLSSLRWFVGPHEYELSYMLLGDGDYHYAADQVWEGQTPVSEIPGMAVAIYPPHHSPYPQTPDNAAHLIIGEHIADAELPQIITQANEVDGITIAAPNARETGITLLITLDGWLEITDAAAGEALADLYDVGGTIQLRDCYAWEFHNDGFGASGAPITYYLRYDLDGDYTITDADASRVKIAPGAQPGWAHIPVGGQHQATDARYGNPMGMSGPNTGLFGYAPTFPAGSYPAAVLIITVRTDYYSPAGRSAGTSTVGPFTIPPGTEYMIANIHAQRGLFKEGAGDPQPITIDGEYELSDGFVGTFSIETNSINSKDAAGVSVQIPVPDGPQPWRVLFRRASLTDKAFDGAVVDEIQLRDLYFIRSVPAGWTPGDATTLLVQTRVNQDASRIKERKLSLAVTRKITADAVADAQLPAVIAAMHTDPRFGRRELTDLDTATLALLQTQIEAATAAGDYPPDPLRVGHTFDDSDITYQEAVELLCNAANLRTNQIGGVLSFEWDYLKDPDMLITHRDIIPGTFTLQRRFGPDNGHDGIELQHTNEQGETVTIYRPSDRSATNPRKIELPGQCGTPMAEYRADREMAALQYLRTTVELETGVLGQAIAPGMRLLVEDCTAMSSIGGEVVGHAGSTLQLSMPVPDGVAAIWLTRRNGDIYQVACAKSGPSAVELAPEVVLPEALYVDHQEERTRYLLWYANNPEVLDLIAEEVEIVSATQCRVRLTQYDERTRTWQGAE